jgi:hypothetical protein
MRKRKTERRNRPHVPPEARQLALAGLPETIRGPTEALEAICFGDAAGLAGYLRQHADSVNPEVVKTIAFLLDPVPVPKATGWVVHEGPGLSFAHAWAEGWRLEFRAKAKTNKYAREKEMNQIGFYVLRLRNQGKPSKQAIDDACMKFGIEPRKMSRRKVEEAYAHVRKLLDFFEPPLPSRRKGSE